MKLAVQRRRANSGISVTAHLSHLTLLTSLLSQVRLPQQKRRWQLRHVYKYTAPSKSAERRRTTHACTCKCTHTAACSLMNRLLIYTCERVASILHYLIACAPGALYVSLGFLITCGIYTSLVSCSLGFGVNSHLTTGCVRIVDFFAATRTHTWVTYGFYLSQMEMFHFHYYWHEHYLSLCREYIIKVNKKWIYCARTEINFYPFPLVWRENQTADRKNWATPAAQSEVLSCLVCHSPQRRDEQVAYAPRMNRTSESGLRVLEAWWERYRYLLSDRGTSRAGHVNYFASQLCQIAHTHT